MIEVFCSICGAAPCASPVQHFGAVDLPDAGPLAPTRPVEPKPLALRWMRAPDVPSDWPMPDYATDGSAGIDLPAYMPHGFTWVGAGMRIWVRTGWHVAIPEGYEGSVRPRSGLAVKRGVTVFNSPGTVDCDFRGEMMVCLFNGNINGRHREPRQWFQKRDDGVLPDDDNEEAHTHDGAVMIKHADRVAQLVIAPVERVRGVVVDALPETARGAGGWGSTGR